MACQENSSESVVSLPRQGTDSAYPEVTLHGFTEWQTPQPTDLSIREMETSLLRPQMAKSTIKFKRTHHLIQNCKQMLKKLAYESVKSKAEPQQAFGLT